MISYLPIKLKNMKLKKTKGKKHRHMIQGLLGIVDGLIRLMTFGCFWSNLQFTYITKMLGK